MKTLGELRDDRTHAIKSCADIVAKCEKEERALTADEQQEFDDYKRKIDELDRAIEARMDFENRKELAEKQLASLTEGGSRHGIEPSDPAPLAINHGIPNEEPETRTLLPARPRYRLLRAFTGPDAEERAYRSGMWLRAVLWRDERAARFCRNHMVFDTRALSEGNNLAGGVNVPAEMSQAIIDLRERHGVFRRFCRVLPIGSDTITIPRITSDLVATFVGEGAEIADSDPAFDAVSLVVKKLGAKTRVSMELAEDAVVDIGDMLTMQFARALALKEDQCGFNGTGAQTFGGIVGVTEKIVDGNHTQGAVAAAAGTDTFAEIDNADITKLMGALPEYAAQNAAFFASRTAAAQTFGRLQAVAGGNTTTTLEGQIFQAYLGHPIIVSQVLPKDDSGGALQDKAMILFGDLSLAATLAERRGFTISTTSDRYWELDQMGIKATERIDINVHDLGDTTDAGPIVALTGTA